MTKQIEKKGKQVVEIKETPTRVVAKQQENSVDTFITQAIQSNLSPETMEKLFALREKAKAEKAREEFTQAFAMFQSVCPIITKTKKVLNKDGTLRYEFAPLDGIVSQIKEPLAQNGLVFTWKVENKDGMITAIAKITHRFGHSEESEFAVPIDKGGFMTEPQKYASALTFAKRYSLINVLGISTGEEDTDATDVGSTPEPKSEKAKIVFLLKMLDEKIDTKDNIEKAIKKLTSLSLTDKNLNEIKSRLEVLVKDKNEYDKEINKDS